MTKGEKVPNKLIDRLKKYTTIALVCVCVLICAFLVKAYFDGKFDSVDTLQTYVSKFGLFAPLVLTLIQAAQVILPVLPGFFGCIVGAVMFGCSGGFWCNYIGISAGSIIAFLLAKKYGQGLVRKMFPKKRYENIAKWAAESKCYTLILFLGMVLPLFPDDFFCYLTGLTDMTTRKFTAIIILGKPWCILAYSFFFSVVIS